MQDNPVKSGTVGKYAVAKLGIGSGVNLAVLCGDCRTFAMTLLVNYFYRHYC